LSHVASSAAAAASNTQRASASQPGSAPATASPGSRRGSFVLAPDGSELSPNAFWSCIPPASVEALFRTAFDFSLMPSVQHHHATAGEVTAPHYGEANSSSAVALNSTLHSLSSTCRVLLLELAKFDLLRFVEWAGRELTQSPPATSFSALSSPLSGAGVTLSVPGVSVPISPSSSFSSSAPASDPASIWAHGCASLKASDFDGWRLQLVDILVSLPLKFAARMTYPLLHALTELSMKMLDPGLAQQPRSTAPVVASTAGPGAIAAPPAIPFSLRSRMAALVMPRLPVLCSRSPLLSLCNATHQLAMVHNPRWLHAAKLSRATTAAQRSALEQESSAVQLQAPSIVLFDVGTGARVRVLEGHAPGSDVLCITFSPNGRRLASYSPRDGAQASLRVWAVDDDDGAVGSGVGGGGSSGGFNPARLLKAVFRTTAVGTQILQLPQLPRAAEVCANPTAAAGCPAAMRFQGAATVVLVREDGTHISMHL